MLWARKIVRSFSDICKKYSYRIKPLNTFTTASNAEMDVLVVIARYEEDLSWVSELEVPYIIYNKGKDNLPVHYNSIKLENIGREGHTYLHYILTNYDSLPKRTIFTQGDPFDHAPNFIRDTNNYINHKETQPLSIQYLEPGSSILKDRPEYDTGIPKCTLIDEYAKNHNGISYYVEKLGGNMQCFWPETYWDQGIQNLAYVKKHKKLTLDSICNKLGLESTNFIYFNYSAIFSATRKSIQINNLTTYRRAMSFLLQDNEHGYLIERLWLYILKYEDEIDS